MSAGGAPKRGGGEERRGEETSFSQVFIVALIGYLPSKLAQNRRGIRRIDNKMQKIACGARGEKNKRKKASLV